MNSLIFKKNRRKKNNVQEVTTLIISGVLILRKIITWRVLEMCFNQWKDKILIFIDRNIKSIKHINNAWWIKHRPLINIQLMMQIITFSVLKWQQILNRMDYKEKFLTWKKKKLITYFPMQIKETAITMILLIISQQMYLNQNNKFKILIIK